MGTNLKEDLMHSQTVDQDKNQTLTCQYKLFKSNAQTLSEPLQSLIKLNKETGEKKVI